MEENLQSLSSAGGWSPRTGASETTDLPQRHPARGLRALGHNSQELSAECCFQKPQLFTSGACVAGRLTRSFVCKGQRGGKEQDPTAERRLLQTRQRPSPAGLSPPPAPGLPSLQHGEPDTCVVEAALPVVLPYCSLC